MTICYINLLFTYLLTYLRYGDGPGTPGMLQCTCRTTVHQYPKLLHDSTCIQRLITGWWFRDIGSARTAVGHSLSLAR